MTTANISLTAADLVNRKASNNNNNGYKEKVERISSAPNPSRRPSIMMKNQPLGKINRGAGSRRSSLSMLSGAKQRMSLKFSAKSFVTKLAGDLEKYYELGEMLGEGAYGSVYACTHIDTGARRAVKVIPKSLDDEQNENVIKEFNVIKELDHPNVLKSYALFENDTHFNIVTDLIQGGELYDLLESEFTELEVKTLLKSMLGCMNYCHSHNIVHRDLKPENVMLEINQDFNKIKVIDFGLADFFKSAQDDDDEDDDTDASATTFFTRQVGSSFYMSPQVIEGNYTQKCDIWSCGVIAFVCLGGYAPFEGDDEAETAQQILDSEETGIIFDDPVWDDFSDIALDFLQYLLAYDEKDRPTAAQALAHPWFTDDGGNVVEMDDATQRKTMEDKSEMRESARTSIESLRTFHSAESKLKQCTYSLIASQILTKKEREVAEEMFRELDRDSDGKICEQDMIATYKDHYDMDLSEDDLAGIMYEVNLSGSGAITYSEFIIASMLERGLVSEHNLEMAFHMLDKDSSGFLTFDNLKEILGVEDDMEDYVNRRIIAPADRDGDGKISLQDFHALFAEPPIPIVEESESEEAEEPEVNLEQMRRTSAALGGAHQRQFSSIKGGPMATRRKSMRKSVRNSVRTSFRASQLLGNNLEGLRELQDEFGGEDSKEDSLLNSEPNFSSLMNIFEQKSGSSNTIPSMFQCDSVQEGS